MTVEMKAIVLKGYGSPDQLQLEEVVKPSPSSNEVLVRVFASTVTLGDCELRTLTLPLWTRIPMRIFTGFSRPRRFIPGMEMAGIVEAVGKNVKGLREGDAVFGSTGMGMGGNAEYKSRVARGLGVKPSQISYAEAATISVGGINALHFLRNAAIRQGQQILINGAGGSIGTYGVQIAKLYGGEVTAVDHTSKLEMLKSIGADHVIDYTAEDFSRNGKKYDVIFDMVYTTPYSKAIGSLKDGGIYLMANPGPRRMMRSAFLSIPGGKKVFFSFASETQEDLEHIADLMASGKIKAVIDRTYPLEKAAEAHAYVEKGLKKGCVVITIGDRPADV
jgi:NADPH:quinone reductase-like Zn-dependent oxidoreductase